MVSSPAPRFENFTVTMTSFRTTWLTIGLLLGLAARSSPAAEPVDFNRDIRPILSNNCYKCHGPDGNQRQADLRFDLEGIVGRKLESGLVAIKPRDPAGSELVRRITSADPDVHMPPPDSGKVLTARQTELLGRWIDEGAAWQGHWSFEVPQRPTPPAVDRPGWKDSPIDAFVLARLRRAGLEPSPAASRENLIRRVTFDLTGLPPTIEEVDAFLADNKPLAYERVVDRLLKSPRYGEHQTRYWLDAARYGDTHGLHLDNRRSIWPYRDWVIQAFNSNMPFDRFTVEQLAGDLLPNPTRSQLVATGFNRCNVTTSEGGAIAEEYRFKYGVDRVETTATVWLGLTMGCAVCHEHKFDPVSQPEFYKFLAYFNSLTEKAMDGNAVLPPPSVRVPTIEQQRELDQLNKSIAALRSEVKKVAAATKYTDPGRGDKATAPKPIETVWIDDSLPAGAKPTASGSGLPKWEFVTRPKHPVHSGKKASRRKATGLGQHFFTGANPGLKISAGDRLFAWVHLDPLDLPQQIMLQFNDGNWEHRAFWGKDLISWGKPGTPSRHAAGTLPAAGKWVRLEVAAADVGLKPGAVLNGWAFTQHGGTVIWDTAGIVTNAGPANRLFDSLAAWEDWQRSLKKSPLPADVLQAIRVDAAKRTPAGQALVRNHFLEHAFRGNRKALDPLVKKIKAAGDRIAAIDKAMPSTLIMKDMKSPRQTYVLKRGQYDQPDKTRPVQPGVPASLPPLPDDAPANRLGLATWLVASDHPLTARVSVNRFWLQYFGTGLVKTAEDFGSQGEWPSHPALLDWLATEFVGSGWDVKELQKLIVMSASYRQSSRFRPDAQQADPENRLLWRGPRFRLDAEMLRDMALSVSGSLVEKLGGPSVRPYQPAGLWKAVGYSGSNTVKFVQDHGDALYRRSMYTFWKRTAAPPTMLTFDAPSRESCVVRRARTNSPLQALLLLNDVQFVEAARGLGQRMLAVPGSDRDRLAHGFRLVTSRRPRPAEQAILLETYQAHLAEYRARPDSARKLLTIGESKRDDKLDVGRHAAWTMIANLLLNLDEALTKN